MLMRREELYEEVWRTPLQQLAKKYGISDVGLKKICKKLNIPTPGRGYWGMVKGGITLPQPPLPKLKQGAPDCHTITSQKPYSDKKSTYDLPPEASSLIHLALRLSNSQSETWQDSPPHELITLTQKALEESSPDKYGILQAYQEERLSLRVSKDCLDRGLQILNTLLFLLEQLGLKTKNKKNNYHTRPDTLMEILGEEISFSLNEKIRRRDHIPSKDANRWWTQKYDYEPTGILTLEIHTWYPEGIRKKWSDSDSKRLEGQLSDFIIGATKIAVALKQRRLGQEELARREKELRRKHEEEEAARQLEEKRRKDLENQAANWIKAQQLREYIFAVEKRAEFNIANGHHVIGLEKWITWARQHADRIDPLSSGLPSLPHDSPTDA